MKNTILAAAAFAATALAPAAHAEIDGRQLLELAVKDCIAEAQASLADSGAVPSAGAIAILPLKDGETLTGLLKNALSAAGKTCVEGKDDPVFAEILKEIEWDARKADILDAATIDRFGKLKSAQYLMYGELRRLAGDARSVLAELELHVSEIATKRHVWGGSFVRRHYAPGADPKGAIEIPSDVRAALIDGIRAKAAESIAKSAKLGAVKRVAMLPVAGDIDRYAEGLFRDVLAKSSVTPVNLDVATRAEARFALREGPGKADAIAYGALRDIDAKVVETQATGETTCSALMELQLWIEKGATREILWSDTVQFSKEFTVGPRGLWDRLCHLFPSLKESPARIVWVPLAFIVGLLVLRMFFKAVTRTR